MQTSLKVRVSYAKPVIGLAGGIGSGKSFVAEGFAQLGCGVIDSDRDAHEALALPEVVGELKKWWGPAVLRADGTPDRRFIAGQVFNRPENLEKLKKLIHPVVAEMRKKKMREMMADPLIKGIVWDSPLLLEVGLDRECTAVVFVRSSAEVRLGRVVGGRGWTAEELKNRENFQFSLDKKEELADYVVDNSGEASATLRQVHEIFSQILARK